MKGIIHRIALLILSLLLRVPFALGIVVGVVAAGAVLCIAAFQNGFYRVYGEG